LIEAFVGCNPACIPKKFSVNSQTDSLSFIITTVYDLIDFYVNYGDGYSEAFILNSKIFIILL
jgi:hypothetical protein